MSKWSARLSVPVKPALIEPLRTLADVRDFIRDIVPVEHHGYVTWRHVSAELAEAARTGQTESVRVALVMVLAMNGVLDRQGG